jgi:hypothetical protein
MGNSSSNFKKNLSRFFYYFDVPSELAFIPQQGDISQDVTFKRRNAGCSQQKGGLRMGTKKGGRTLPSRRKRATLILKSHSLMVRLFCFMALLITLISFTQIFMHNPCQSH